jgi:PKD repeat protein
MSIHRFIFIFLVFTCFCVLQIRAQDSTRVLFLGNSYTSVNNLPLLVKNLAASFGKTFIIDQNVPGGYTMDNHVNNLTSLSKIKAGNWDYVVIQEQSQIPTIAHYRYNSMYPSMLAIKDSVLKYNPCTQIITYMTWGRRFGGQQCDGSGTYCSPVFRDFNHMQDSLKSAYLQISDSMKVLSAPVGIAWQNVLNDTSLVLHQSDNSHPNLNGSYLAACTIFSTITRQQSYGLTNHAGLSAPLANYLQSKADQTVFAGVDDWNLYIYQPIAAFTSNVLDHEVPFTNESLAHVDQPLSYQWYFGDGDSSTQSNPVHRYTQSGIYQVMMIASACVSSDTVEKTVVIVPPTNQKAYSIFPNPASHGFNIRWHDDSPKQVFIFNNMGQRVAVKNMNTAAYYVPISSLASGLYFVKIVGTTQEALVPLLINR